MGCLKCGICFYTQTFQKRCPGPGHPDADYLDMFFKKLWDLPETDHLTLELHTCRRHSTYYVMETRTTLWVAMQQG